MSVASTTSAAPTDELTEWLDLLCCPNDAAPLRRLKGELSDGKFACTVCAAEFPVRDGIVRCLPAQPDDQRKADEMYARDAQAADYENNYRERGGRGELLSSYLRVLRPQAGDTVADLGCGTGIELLRYLESIS